MVWFSWLVFSNLLLIGIYNMQSWTATEKHRFRKKDKYEKQAGEWIIKSPKITDVYLV